MTPIFVFDGQSNVGKNEVALRKAKDGLLYTEKAWKLYIDNEAEIAVRTFGASGTFMLESSLSLFLTFCRCNSSTRAIHNSSRGTS